MNLHHKKIVLLRRRQRIRKGIFGSEERPRLSLHFSGKHIYAQCVDDDKGCTLAYLSTQGINDEPKIHKTNVDGAAKFGKLFGELALKAGIKKVIFDRGIKRYHGKVKAFADSVREVGIVF